jgi:hypothetical protein
MMPSANEQIEQERRDTVNEFLDAAIKPARAEYEATKKAAETKFFAAKAAAWAKYIAVMAKYQAAKEAAEATEAEYQAIITPA